MLRQLHGQVGQQRLEAAALHAEQIQILHRHLKLDVVGQHEQTSVAIASAGVSKVGNEKLVDRCDANMDPGNKEF